MEYIPYQDVNTIDDNELILKASLKSNEVKSGYIRFENIFMEVCTCGTLNKLYSLYCRKCKKHLSEIGNFNYLYNTEFRTPLTFKDSENLQKINTQVQISKSSFLLNLLSCCVVSDSRLNFQVFYPDSSNKILNLSLANDDNDKPILFKSQESLIDIKSDLKYIYILTNFALKRFPIYLLFTNQIDNLEDIKDTVDNFKNKINKQTNDRILERQINITDLIKIYCEDVCENNFSSSSKLHILGDGKYLIISENKFYSNHEKISDYFNYISDLSDIKISVFKNIIFIINNKQLLKFKNNDNEFKEIFNHNFGNISYFKPYSESKVFILNENSKLYNLNIFSSEIKELISNFANGFIDIPYSNSKNILLVNKNSIRIFNTENKKIYNYEFPIEDLLVNDNMKAFLVYSENKYKIKFKEKIRGKYQDSLMVFDSNFEFEREVPQLFDISNFINSSNLLNRTFSIDTNIISKLDW